MRIHRNSLRNVLLAAIAILIAAIFVSASLAAPGRAKASRDVAKPAGKFAGGPAQRKTQLEAWKQQRRALAGKSVLASSAPGTPAVGRPSMVINNGGTILYTKQFAGTACDPDLNEGAHWTATTAHAQNDVVEPTSGGGGFNFRATNAGTSGATEPAWPTTFGSTILDGTITWQASDRRWVANRTYPLGTTVGPTAVFTSTFGFTFRAIQAGTTGPAPPVWPDVIGGTVTDGTVIWQAKAFWPGQFTGCDPMKLISRASGGAETVLTSEGDAVGGAGEQLSGWSEFYAFNNGGKAAFRAAIAGLLTEEDEGGSGIFTVGPGPGLTEIAQSNTVVSGRTMCGFSAMIGMNDAGQVLYDAYAPEVIAAWQPSHAYPSFTQVMPTVANGFFFFAQNSATSGTTEPVWPTSVGATVSDGGITWVARVATCNEDFHGITRFTSGPGNQLLMAVGTNVGGGTTVVGFGHDAPPAIGTCSACSYNDIDGFINASGHASTAVALSDDSTAVYLLIGPGTFTQVARTGSAGPGGNFGSVYARTALNNLDQVIFKAQVNGVDKLIRWTPPSTYAVVASVGDDNGTREGGAASGETFVDLGFYADINNPGNVVFQATLSTGPHAYYFWNASTGIITEIARDDTAAPPMANAKRVQGASSTAALTILPHNLSSEMATLNDSNVVAFTSGAGDPENPDEGSELTETGLHLWTKLGGVQNMVQNGDTVNGFSVTGVQAQHPSFRRRQLNSVGCTATQFLANGADPEDNAEGNGTNNVGVPPGPQLFVGCVGIIAPTPTPTTTGTPAFTRTPVFTPVPGAAAGIPTLSGGMLAFFGLALAAAAALILLTRKR